MRLEDPRGLGAAVRRDGGRQGARGRPADPRQDQHGRVRDGFLHRALGVRRHAQPVGPDPDPGRLRRRLGRGGGRVRGADRARHRHRRLDPPARRGHRHRRREADVRRGLALRPRRAGQLARPGRPGDPHRPRRGAAARDHRRARPQGLHLDRPAAARAGRGREAGRDRRPVGRADRRGDRARWRGLPGRRADPVPGVGRPAGQGRCRRGRGVVPPLRACAGDVLPDPAGRGVQQPGPLRRDALRPAGAARGHRGAVGRGRHARHPRGRLRRRGQAPDHPRHLRALERLLRRLLRAGPEGADPDLAGLREGLRAGRRAGLADRADHGVPHRRPGRRPDGDVPQRPGHHPGQPLRRSGHLGAERPRGRGRPAGRLPDPGAGARRRPGLPGGCRARVAAARAVGRPAARPGPGPRRSERDDDHR